ncbi:hypothetical protein PIB30_092878 [Stylosanthes scabra]|uniref:Serine-threonine/tyrosine-protein kinase catalytic domain-containing protein n=1 Tax=Stylosanthes scabra TaxID=79078 RepID=A0ABU6WT99_9FABA|nr:hypothetical protein [Stylosanthes scabra]
MPSKSTNNFDHKLVTGWVAFGFCNQEKGKKIIVYEYMANGSLSDYLSNRNKEPLSWNKRLDICIGVARALHYLQALYRSTLYIEEHVPTLEKIMDPVLKGKIASECWQVFTSVIPSCLRIEAEERSSMGEVEICSLIAATS